jgi:hypothetical protein
MADADEPVKLIQHINRFGNGGKTMEFNMFLGQKQRIPSRSGRLSTGCQPTFTGSGKRQRSRPPNGKAAALACHI